MNRIKEKYFSFIDKKIIDHISNSRVYKAEGRNDEANLEMIKAKIFELFKVLFIIDTRQLEGIDFKSYKDINLFGDYLLRFETVSANWIMYLEKARENCDNVKLVIEMTKLAIAQEIRDKFISTVKEGLKEKYD
jgi:hypothetical protein